MLYRLSSILLSWLLIIGLEARANDAYLASLTQKDLLAFEHKLVDRNYDIRNLVTEYFPALLKEDYKTQIIFEVNLAKLIYQDETMDLAEYNNKFYRVLESALDILELGYERKYEEAVAKNQITAGHGEICYGKVIGVNGVAINNADVTASAIAVVKNAASNEINNTRSINKNTSIKKLITSCDGAGNEKVYLVDENFWIHQGCSLDYAISNN